MEEEGWKTGRGYRRVKIDGGMDGGGWIILRKYGDGD